jgi:hypothetical protein
VTALAFAEDRRLVYSGGRDGTRTPREWRLAFATEFWPPRCRSALPSAMLPSDHRRSALPLLQRRFTSGVSSLAG